MNLVIKRCQQPRESKRRPDIGDLQRSEFEWQMAIEQREILRWREAVRWPCARLTFAPDPQGMPPLQTAILMRSNHGSHHLRLARRPFQTSKFCTELCPRRGPSASCDGAPGLWRWCVDGWRDRFALYERQKYHLEHFYVMIVRRQNFCLAGYIDQPPGLRYGDHLFPAAEPLPSEGAGRQTCL